MADMPVVSKNTQLRKIDGFSFFRNFVMQHHFREIVNFFLAKSRETNRNVTFYPSAKRRRDLKIFSLGVIFHGGHACGV